jgi:hypothetical protein
MLKHNHGLVLVGLMIYGFFYGCSDVVLRQVNFFVCRFQIFSRSKILSIDGSNDRTLI